MHCIADLRIESLYSELPILYKTAWSKINKITNWDEKSIENLKWIWNTMAISQIYDLELLVLMLIYLFNRCTLDTNCKSIKEKSSSNFGVDTQNTFS